MDDKIKRLEELLAGLERELEVALQSEEATQIAYREGFIDGVKQVLEELKTL